MDAYGPIVPLVEIPGGVRIADHLGSGSGPDFAIFDLAGGGRRLARIRLFPDGLRVVEHFEIRPGLFALDRLEFRVGEHEFAETGRWRAEGGPNLHPEPIRLPAVLRPGEVYAPVPGVAARLGWSGRVRLGDRELGALRIDVEVGGARFVQWLGEGLGEIAVGPPGSPERWLAGWRGGGRSLLGGVPEAWTEAELPGLPLESPGVKLDVR